MATAARRVVGRRKLSLKRKLLFALCAVVGFFVLTLGGLELAGRVYVHFKFGVPGKSYGIYMFDPDLGATHRPNSYNSNSQLNNFGFRNIEDTPDVKPPGSLRIYCSGGSTTFCYNLSTREAWPEVLQGKLRTHAGHEKDQVLNAGQICFSLGHELILARRMIPRLRPDYALIFTGINEGANARNLVYQDGVNLDDLLSAPKWGVISRELDQARWFKRNSVLVRLWDYEIKKRFANQATAEFRAESIPSPATTPDKHPWVMANLEHVLPEYLKLLRENGCTPILMRFGDNGGKSWYQRDCIEAWRDRAVEIARKEGALVVDLAAVVEKQPNRAELFITTGLHVTKPGAELYASELEKFILALPPKGQVAGGS